MRSFVSGSGLGLFSLVACASVEPLADDLFADAGGDSASGAGGFFSGAGGMVGVLTGGAPPLASGGAPAAGAGGRPQMGGSGDDSSGGRSGSGGFRFGAAGASSGSGGGPPSGSCNPFSCKSCGIVLGPSCCKPDNGCGCPLIPWLPIPCV